MDNKEALLESANTLTHLIQDGDINTINKYKILQKESILICKNIIGHEGVYYNNIHDLVNAMERSRTISPQLCMAMRCFEISIEQILNNTVSPSTDLFEYESNLIIYLINHAYGKENISFDFDSYYKYWKTVFVKQNNTRIIKRMRCTFLRREDKYIVVTSDNDPTREQMKVDPSLNNTDTTFSDTIEALENGMKINLVDVCCKNNILIPAIIVLEPDYLMDISTLADCIKDYGEHPANYYYKLLTYISNRKALILGNIVNFFLDEWIYSPATPDYLTCMKKIFRKYSLELITCKEIDEDETEFFNSCKYHFNNIQRIIHEILNNKKYGFNTNDAVLEPSYICETLGIQGRLDYMQRDMSSLIELKSGKANEYSNKGHIEALLPNKVQMILYLAVLEYSLGKDHNNTRAYLLYTKYPLLYNSPQTWNLVRTAINTRNRIVASEYQIHKHNSIEFTADILNNISPETINERHLNNKLWRQYLSPQITVFRNDFKNMSRIEQIYYLSLFTFISNELYISKIGNGEQDRNSSSSIWNYTTAEKEEKGIIIKDLKIIENRISKLHAPYIIFRMPEMKSNSILNFRNGDPIIVYEKNNSYDSATNKMIFKGNIEYIDNDNIKIRLRSSQKNTKVINDYSTFSIEPDYNDKPIISMFSSLYNFEHANIDRKSLILGEREPDFDYSLLSDIDNYNDFERIATKSIAAKDMLLVIGPPGTGKTSRALKLIVEKHLDNKGSNILLLSYTNRAVDEICKSISNISPSVDYIRLGNELSCEEEYRDHLIENKLDKCSNRKEARKIINDCRIFVSTVVTLQSKPEIFKLKQFDCAIIDEATQILEPQILGILTAKCEDGENAIKKFIMIGDNKQLPAITLQNDSDSMIRNKQLTDLGFHSFKESIFERLYRKYNRTNHICIDMLCKQGRMHKDIAEFPNRYFYFGKLQTLGLSHQTEENKSSESNNICNYRQVTRQRMAFIPSKCNAISYNDKTNEDEATIASSMAYEIYMSSNKDFNPQKTLGIIAPYKNQIALIKQKISEYGIKELNDITVDTVERYQGSERDIIIFTFCINKPYQIKTMTNNIVENGMVIDRKLNVALTRARKQLFIIGNEKVLIQNSIYSKLIEYMKKNGFYINKI